MEKLDTEALAQEIAEMLLEIRQAGPYSQNELSRILEASPRQVQRWESMSHLPRQNYERKIRELYAEVQEKQEQVSLAALVALVEKQGEEIKELQALARAR